jgi:uncharacterized membrane protein YkoI
MRTLATLLAALVVGLAMPSVAAPPPHAHGPEHGGGPASGQATPAPAGPASTPDPGPTAPTPAAAAPPTGPADGPPPAGKGHDEPKAGGKKDGPPGQAKKDDEPAKPPKKDPDPSGQEKKAGKSSSAVPPDQDVAQSAVERLEALPLAKIIKVAEGRTAGKVINARLLRVSGVLLYQLTRLDDKGRTWRDYYNAATGNPVVLR